jgi:DNA invertase Pin-like site-specific DNA recombinase
MSKRYFAYVRVSTVKQGEWGSSLAEQKSAIEAYAARNGLAITCWFEEMETAAKQGRRQFSELLIALKAGKAEGLIIHKIDRSARNLRDWSELGDLIDRGIDVRFVTDNFDLLSRGGRLSADIQAVVAADYIRNLREEVKKGIYGRLKQGIYPFGAPIGYLNTGKAKPKIVDPVKGPLVRRLFERYATGSASFEVLRHEFAKLGLTAIAGKPLARNTLSDILNNPFYAGIIRLGSTGETFQGIHEPLIPAKLFEQVQAILRGKQTPRTKRHQYLFRQMVGCGRCGRRMLTGERQKSHIYYRCHSGSCGGISWREDLLETVVLNHIRRIRFNAGDVGMMGTYLEEEYKAQDGDRAELRAALKLHLDQLDGRISRMTDLLIDMAIDQPTFATRKEQLLLERQKLVEELGRARQCSLLRDIFGEFEQHNNELLRYEILSGDEKRELIEIICSNFSVTAENIVFELRNPYKELANLDPYSGCAHQRDDVRTFRAVEILKRWAYMPVSRPRRPHIPRRAGSKDMGELN